MLELATPMEIMEKLAVLIETERKMQRLQQKELAKRADVPLPTYKRFIYDHKISFENALKLLMALRLFENIGGLLKQRPYQSLDELKREDALPKRIDK